MSRSVHQHIDGFLKGTPHKSTSILPINTVPSDGHQMTLCGHYVTQQGQMSIVYVQPVELQHSIHLLLDRLSHSLDSQYLENLANVIGERPHRIDVPLAEYFHH